MDFEIIPKFREIDAYVIAASLVVAMLLFAPGSFSSLGALFIEDQLAFGVLLLVFLFWISVSLNYAVSDRIPNRNIAGFIVSVCLVLATFLSFYGGWFWMSELSKSQDPLDRIVVILPFFGVLRALGIAFLFRSMKSTDYQRHFVYKNTPRHELAMATVILLIAGFIARFILDYPGIMVCLMMIESGRIVGRAPEGGE